MSNPPFSVFVLCHKTIFYNANLRVQFSDKKLKVSHFVSHRVKFRIKEKKDESVLQQPSVLIWGAKEEAKEIN